MRVVLDTNVLISVLLFKKNLSKIYDLLDANKLTLCFNYLTVKEFIEVIKRPKFSAKIKELNLTPNEILLAVLEKSEIFPEKEIGNIIKEDPSDNKFLSCTLSSGASFIVS